MSLSGGGRVLLHDEVTFGCTAVQSQKAVAAYFSSKRLLPSGFAEQCTVAGAEMWTPVIATSHTGLACTIHMIACHMCMPGFSQRIEVVSRRIDV